MILRTRNREVDLSTPVVMGILNVTPDSFSDGGEYSTVEQAVRRASLMIGAGASIIDVGPESTRPGSSPVPEATQRERAIPVIEALRRADPDISISIDTRISTVARAALDAGADIVNDISALRDDPAMVGVVAESNAAVVLMHRRGTPADMQRDGGPIYGDVVREIAEFLWNRVDWAVARGIEKSQVIVDPGIGFGKRVEDNLRIMRELASIAQIGPPVLVGVSRKAFVGAVLDIDDPKQRDSASVACAAMVVLGGATIVRAHDVRRTAEAVRLAAAVRYGERELVG